MLELFEDSILFDDILVFQDETYLEFPSESLDLSFVLQCHVPAGRAQHLDVRLLIDKDTSIGWTLTGLPGQTDAPKTLEEAKSGGQVAITDFLNQLQDPMKKTYALPKAVHSSYWHKMNKVLGDDMGMMFIVDKGKVEYGFQEADFHEYFFHGEKFNGRIVFRKLDRSQIVKSEEGDSKLGRTVFIWLMWKTKDQTPFVLGSRAVQKRLVPPRGISALPHEIKKDIPEALQYWNGDTEKKRLELRDQLVESMKTKNEKTSFSSSENDFILKHLYPIERMEKELNELRKHFLEGMETENEKTSFSSSENDFVLQYRWFRGPLHKRLGASESYFDLRLASDGSCNWYILDGNPLNVDQVVSKFSGSSPIETMKLGSKGKEEIPPGTEKLNETKDTPVFVEIIDSGKYEIMTDDSLFKKIRFNGRNLKGEWTLSRTDEKDVFDFQKQKNL